MWWRVWRVRLKLLEKHLMPYCGCAKATSVITRIIMPLVSQQQMPLKVLSPPAAPFLSLHFFQCAFLFLCAFLSLCVSRWAG